MPLQKYAPGYDGQLMEIPPRKGMRGRIKATLQFSLKGPEPGAEIEVTGEGFDEQHVRGLALDSGKEFDVPHWNVEIGRLLFVEGAWRPLNDPKVVAWARLNCREGKV